MGTFESEELAATVFTKTSWLLTHNSTALSALAASEDSGAVATPIVHVKTESEAKAEAEAAAATLAALFSSAPAPPPPAPAPVPPPVVVKEEDKHSITALLTASSSSTLSPSKTTSKNTVKTEKKQQSETFPEPESSLSLEPEDEPEDDSLVGRNEVVLRRRARYGPYFLIGRLMDWFNTEEGSGNLGTNNSTYSTYSNSDVSSKALTTLSSSFKPEVVAPVLEVVATIGDELPIEVMFGCVMLPEPAHCYQAAIYTRPTNNNTSTNDSSSSASSKKSKTSTSSNTKDDRNVGKKSLYGKRERSSLFNILNDKTIRRQCWDKKLSSFFRTQSTSTSTSTSSKNSNHVRPRLLGSPVVDFLQGSYQGLDQVLRTLSQELKLNENNNDDYDDDDENVLSGKKNSTDKRSTSSNKRSASSSSRNSSNNKNKQNKSRKNGSGGISDNVSSTMLVDDSAVQDNEQSWVQCDDCSKWRRVPWYVDTDNFENAFNCSSSSIWGQNLSCSDPEEVKPIFVTNLI